MPQPEDIHFAGGRETAGPGHVPPADVPDYMLGDDHLGEVYHSEAKPVAPPSDVDLAQTLRMFEQ